MQRSVTAGISSEPRKLPILATNDLDEACTRLGEVFCSHRVEFTTRNRTLSVAHEGLSWGKVSFHRLRYGGVVRLLAPEMGNFFLFQVPLSGAFRIWRNRAAADVGERQAYAVNPGETFAKDWDIDGDQLIIRIERVALEAYARILVGSDIKGPIHFKPVVVDEVSDRLLSLEQYVRHVPGTPAHLKRQIEELVISTILISFPNTISNILSRPAGACAPFYVKRVEDAIESSPLAEMSLQDMANVAGVSVRTLYYGFQKFRDTTPLAYLKNKRLDIAKQKLLLGDPRHTSVTSVALECGFTHLGKFASNFRRRFGRAPSSVLRFKDQ